MEDKTHFEEQHDLLYKAVCATNNCIQDYVGETARRIVERAKDHIGQDQHPDLVKRAIENIHLPVVKDDFTKLDSGYRNNTYKRKIAEALMIKVIRSSLHIKEKSVELKLFNGISTLDTKVCSYTRSKFDIRDTTVRVFQLFWCCCWYFLIFLMLLLTLNNLYLL